MDTVVRASVRLRSSPLHDLVLGHLRTLWRNLGTPTADPGAAALAHATTELVRALLVSATRDPDDGEVRSVLHDCLVTRIMAYARRHLTDPDLTPDRLAHEHAVSRRQLYAVLGRAGISLEQWVISERLEAARRLLVSPRHAGLPVSAVAARCGFTSPGHIARRFRAAYGVTPREWRRLRIQDTVRIRTSVGR
ncbi:helix-turn-helix transcriptional regulator [Streptomyces sp. NPDC048717]|uniref:helix-turn-helix transcriptional regulator n=1 Tax=Streptomyces sp. NPDC048717 TaxID=3154928 RepID=UPI003432E84E